MKIRLCRLRWRSAMLLWAASAVCFIAAPAWAVPIKVEGIDLSFGQLFLLLGLAMAWGDTRRKVEDLRDEVKRLPCRMNGCNQKQEREDER